MVLWASAHLSHLKWRASKFTYRDVEIVRTKLRPEGVKRGGQSIAALHMEPQTHLCSPTPADTLQSLGSLALTQHSVCQGLISLALGPAGCWYCQGHPGWVSKWGCMVGLRNFTAWWVAVGRENHRGRKFVWPPHSQLSGWPQSVNPPGKPLFPPLKAGGLRE